MRHLSHKIETDIWVNFLISFAKIATNEDLYFQDITDKVYDCLG